MISMRKVAGILAAVAMAGVGLLGRAEAATISVNPSSQTIAPGGTASVDIVLSGLLDGETVGAFSLLLSFNNAILGAPNLFTNDPGNVMGAQPLDLSPGFAGGTLSLFYLADAAISEDALKLAEGAGFILATVSFTGLTEGLSALNLAVSPDTGVFLSNYDGDGVIPVGTVNNGSVCVDDPQVPGTRCNVVPEPGTLSLLGAVLIGAFAARRRRGSRPA